MRRCVLFVLLGTLSRFAIAQSADIPLNNWTVPPYRTSGALTTMTDVTPGVGFVGVTPCRLVDTRQAGFPAGYGAPPLSPGVIRNFDLNSDPLCPGIPTGVDAYSLNVTVTLTAGSGHLVIYPQGGSQPTVSSINYFAGQTIANAVIVPAGTNGGVTVVAGVSATHLIIDINGYFTDQYNPGVSFHAVSSTIAPAIRAENASTLDDAVAIEGVITSTQGFNQAAIRGVNKSLNDTGIGVEGVHEGSGVGVQGTSSWIGVNGQGGYYGTWGTSDSGDTGATGVFGWATAGSGNIFGGKFVSGSAADPAAGVKGVSGYGDPLGDSGDCGPCATAGVRGVSGDPNLLAYGVLGVSTRGAVGGMLIDRNNPTMTKAEGYLGFQGAGSPYGVLSHGGTLGTGLKSFADPHPTDPSKVIKYVSLEGPESGTYFRGRSRFQRGTATIAVPGHFRMVTDPVGLSIQVTPIGKMASVAVLQIGLDRIVVEGSRDVEFFYTVTGIRKAFRDFEPVVEENIFVPPGSDARIPGYLSDEQKRLLIQNGTYKADGTVNMETARRLGWDKVWEKSELPTPHENPD